nr:immunoglobulin light chain junction region [Macaca mulatta]MOV62332.1 immunoglobulin light chain junction region [Macaca mulatta]MOV64263.1 immunoglobulin light chain junction region [Macaca mulatta]
CYQHSSDYSF